MHANSSVADTPPNMKLHGATAEMYHVKILKGVINGMGLRAEISFTTPLIVSRFYAKILKLKGYRETLACMYNNLYT